MKEKIISVVGVIAWIIILILILEFNQMENKFWLGFLSGALATLSIGGVIIQIRRIEK